MEASPKFMLDRDFGKFTLKERVLLLRELYSRVLAILDTYFSGYLGVPDDKLNLYYIKTCLIVEKVLEEKSTSPLSELQKDYERPFASLFAELGEGDIWWDEGGVKRSSFEFKGRIDEAFVQLGQPKLIDPAIKEFLLELDEYLQIYSRRKLAEEKRFENGVDEIGKQYQSQGQSGSEKYKKGKIGFIHD